MQDRYSKGTEFKQHGTGSGLKSTISNIGNTDKSVERTVTSAKNTVASVVNTIDPTAPNVHNNKAKACGYDNGAEEGNEYCYYSGNAGACLCPGSCHGTRHRLPSGFGTVRFLGKGRRRAYAVHPPARPVELIDPVDPVVPVDLGSAESAESAESAKSADSANAVDSSSANSIDISGSASGSNRDGAGTVRRHRIWKRPPAICYVPTREIGRKILTLYHAGKYRKGMELEIEEACSSRLEKGGQPETAEVHGAAGNLEEDYRPMETQEDHGLPGNQEKNYKPGKNRKEPAHPEKQMQRCEMPEARIAHKKIKEQTENCTEASTETEVYTESQTEAGQIKTHAEISAEPLSGSFAEVYEMFYAHKFGAHAGRELSKSSRNAMNAAYQKFSDLHARPMDRITVDDLQDMVNDAADAGYSRSAVRQMVTLAHQLYKYAYPREMCKKECGRYVEMPACAAAEEHHQDFTDEELEVLWENYRETGDPIVRSILVMCYSGFRVGEYEGRNFRIFLPEKTAPAESGPFNTACTSSNETGACRNEVSARAVTSTDSSPAYFQGGFKTEAGRNRIVPIHSAILPLVMEMMVESGKADFFCGRTSGWFREKMKAKLAELGIDTANATDVRVREAAAVPAGSATGRTEGRKASDTVRFHTPHSTRHTFSRLCESYAVSDADRRRLLGHSFGSDITNGVYGHRSTKELHAQIEKIRVPYGAARPD